MIFKFLVNLYAYLFVYIDTFFGYFLLFIANASNDDIKSLMSSSIIKKRQNNKFKLQS